MPCGTSRRTGAGHLGDGDTEFIEECAVKIALEKTAGVAIGIDNEHRICDRAVLHRVRLRLAIRAERADLCAADCIKNVDGGTVAAGPQPVARHVCDAATISSSILPH